MPYKDPQDPRRKEVVARFYAKPENRAKQSAYVKQWLIRKKEALAGREQPMVCDGCGMPPRGKRGLSFDHCHQTGVFRGWLCLHCNRALGLLQDDPERLLKLAAYLQRKGN